MSEVHRAMETPKAACELLYEGVALIRPYFLAQPTTFAHLTEHLCNDYLAVCRELAEEPDMDLLAPVFEELEKLTL